MASNTGDFTTRREGDVIILTPIGKIDGGAVEAVRAHVLKEVAPGNKLVIDLSEVTYLSSTGIGAILRFSMDYQLKLAAISEPVRAVLELAEAHRLVDVHETVALALRALH